MDTNQPAESSGRGLRAMTVITSLGTCLILFWGIKSVFYNSKVSENEAASVRKSSFTTAKRNSQPASAPEANPAITPAESAVVPLPAATPAPETVGVTATASLPPAAPPVPAVIEPAVVHSSGAATDYGVISGKVFLNGVPEPEKPLPLDPSCGNLHKGAKPTTQFYVVAADGGLADVFVHIVKGLENRNFLPPEKALVLDQVGCIYVPYVSGAQVGQTIEVRNSDPLLHNVHPTPAVTGNQEHNKAQLPKGQPLLFRWNNPEVFLRFKCDIHPWMFSYIGLVNHPYFAVTDANGNFTIQNVPPGAFTIELYHRKSGKITKDIIVNAGHMTHVDSRIEVVK